MINCIKADLFRIIKKKSIMVLLLLQCLIIIGTGIAAFKFSIPEFSTVSLWSGSFSTIALLNGIAIFIAIFKNDFKSRALQTAIGFGVSRTKIILSRFIEMILLVALHLAIYSIIIILMATVGHMPMADIKELLKLLWVERMAMVFNLILGMIFVYAFEATTVGLIVYICATLSVIDLLIVSVNFIPALKNLKLGEYTITGLIDQIMEGHLKMWPVLIIGYGVVPIVISILAFRKKELEI